MLESQSTSRLMLAATAGSSGLQDRTPCVQERLSYRHQGGRDPRRTVFGDRAWVLSTR